MCLCVSVRVYKTDLSDITEYGNIYKNKKENTVVLRLWG